MKTLTLTKIDENNFQIEITEGVESFTENKVERKVLSSSKASLSSIFEKMYNLGVDVCETKYALNQLDEKMHTKASFGFLGSFVTSWDHTDSLGASC